MWAVVGGIVLSIVIQIMAAKHLVRELAGGCRMMSGRMCVGELRICSPEGRVVLYLWWVFWTFQRQEEEICALSSVMEVLTVGGRNH